MGDEPREDGESARRRKLFRAEALEAHRRARGAEVRVRYVGTRTLVVLWGTSLLLVGGLVGWGVHLAGWLARG